MATEALLYRAFANVLSRYQETKYSSGDLAAADYGYSSSKETAIAGKATNTGASQIVKPSTSDFVADVEISSRKVLSPWQLTYFEKTYQSGILSALPYEFKDENYDYGPVFEAHLAQWPESKREGVRLKDQFIRKTLGQRFKDAGIYPLSKYNEEKDVRGPRKPRPRWSHLYGN